MSDKLLEILCGIERHLKNISTALNATNVLSRLGLDREQEEPLSTAAGLEARIRQQLQGTVEELACLSSWELRQVLNDFDAKHTSGSSLLRKMLPEHLKE